MALFVDIEKKLGDFHLVVKFEAGDEIYSLLGASGCGKSMTLKCIAGIERPDRGKIVLDGVTLFDSEKGINLKPQERRAGYLFQQYALFPNMSVRQNIRCGVRKDASGAEARVEEILQTMQLQDVADLKPSQLSGGQQQRTALGRILINDPDIIMLDEPFSALDTHLRFWMEDSVKKMMRSYGRTVLLISHDRDEVFRMADSIAIMDHGRLLTAGPKHAVFHAPGTVAAARLTGCKNIARAEAIDESHLRVPGWGMTLTTAQECSRATHVGIRLHDVHLGMPEGTGAADTGHNAVGGKDLPEQMTRDNTEWNDVMPNVFTCEVADEIENPFTYTLVLRTKTGTETFGMEINKERWNELRKARQGEGRICLTVHIPPEGVLPLRE